MQAGQVQAGSRGRVRALLSRPSPVPSRMRGPVTYPVRSVRAKAGTAHHMTGMAVRRAPALQLVPVRGPLLLA